MIALPNTMVSSVESSVPKTQASLRTVSWLSGERVGASAGISPNSSARFSDDHLPLPDADTEKAAIRARTNRLAAFALMLLLDGPVDGWAQFDEAPDSTEGEQVVQARGSGGFEAWLEFDRRAHRLVELTYTYPRRTFEGGSAASAVTRKGLTFSFRQIDPTFRLADYKAVDGLVLPHRIVEKIAEGSQLWLIEKYTINPPVDHPLLQFVGQN